MKRIDLTDSKEWYKTNEQAKVYLNLFKGSYASGIINSEDNLLKNNLEDICRLCPENSNYVDLGPGNGKKTLFLCKAIHKRHKLGAYTAVDIQENFLGIEKTIRSKFNIPTKAFNCSFENFLTETPTFQDIFPWNWKFIYLGSTYGNYTDGSMDKLLSDFMFGKDAVYLSSGLRPTNVNELVSKYHSTLPLFEPVVKKHSLPKGGKLKAIFNEKTSSIEQVYELDKVTYVLGLSKKHSIDSFKNQVSRYFTGQFFVEGEHIGFLGKRI